ncbi:ubiquitin carboxyl-terminal hydrolase isozyme L3-like [Centruroides vittatus]|uniref:ubiquitin carboxyl-terminal hydrolase isozyme L3-like n=1 Tax=Centruroides vittatus TaxID=120091 RepID=UPI0035101721
MVPRPILAVILLFPLGDKANVEENPIGTLKQDDNVYFLKQTIRNACGTIALIHAVGNNAKSLNLESDSILSKFLIKTKDETPITRGKILESDMCFSSAHQQYAEEGQTQVPDINAEVNLHFVTFVHVDGRLYELDGRKESPVDHGTTTPETLLNDACRICEKFMARDPSNVNFSVVALTGVETN